MPISAGSGGLRFPLPNRSEIQARQNAAAASAGGSAAASVFGANRRYAGLNNQLKYGAVQAELDRRFRSTESEKERQFKYEQAAADRAQKTASQESSQEFQSGQLDKTQQFQSDQLDKTQTFQSGLLDKTQEFQATQAEITRNNAIADREDEQQFRQEQDRYNFDKQGNLELLRDRFQQDRDKRQLENELKVKQFELDNAPQLPGTGPQTGKAPGSIPVLSARTPEEFHAEAEKKGLEEGDQYIGADGAVGIYSKSAGRERQRVMSTADFPNPALGGY